MFNCQRYKRTSEPGERSAKRTTETRTKIYRPQVIRTGSDFFGPKFHTLPGGQGVETVREITIYQKCIQNEQYDQLVVKYSGVKEDSQAA